MIHQRPIISKCSINQRSIMASDDLEKAKVRRRDEREIKREGVQLLCSVDQRSCNQSCWKQRSDRPGAAEGLFLLDVSGDDVTLETRR